MFIPKFKTNLIKKIIFISCLLLSSIMPTQSFARPNVDFFIAEYQNIFKIMLDSYREVVKEPLDGRLFNVRDPRVSNFISNITRIDTKDKHHFLAMWFQRNLKVNNKNMNYCFVLYDSKKLMELDRYLNSTFPAPIEAVYYLAAHELGHCLVAHQRAIGNIPAFSDLKKEELYAEIFSVLFFLSRQQKEQALSVIRQNMHVDKNSNHYNPEKLKKAYLLFIEQKPTITNMYDLYDISYKYLMRIEEDPNLLNKELEMSQGVFKEKLSNVNKLITRHSHVSLSGYVN